jgi:hypothetical protein
MTIGEQNIVGATLNSLQTHGLISINALSKAFEKLELSQEHKGICADNLCDFDDSIRPANRGEYQTKTEIPFEKVSNQYIDMIQTLEPYGEKHAEPLFCIEGRVGSVKIMGKEQTHLKLFLTHNKQMIDCVGFSMAKMSEYMKPHMLIQIVGSLSINEWQGNKKPNIMIKDIRYEDSIEKHLELIIHMIGEMDDQHIQFILKRSLEPSREVLKASYRQLMQWDTLKRYSIPIIEFTKETYTDYAMLTALICIRIFEEVGLLTYKLTYHTLHFTINHIGSGKKVELEQSKLYNKLIK